MLKKELELLAPAKDFECGKAAIDCGADAIYIGAPKFGARAAVGNSLEDIEALAGYAHKYYAKVYATVNTILYENELEEARNLIYKLYEAGTDAIIIQDMSLLKLDLPPIPLFASTQTHNYEPERIKFLDSAGFSRIILARELSLEQIKAISENTSAELEFFVHGALCVSFSGQCYFSYATTGRSANRGECSQPCRMLYSVEDSNGKTIAEEQYILSLKDLNLSAYLNQLIEAGITSFKIEGRLKDKSYVKNITAYYRQKLDALIEGSNDLKKSSSGKVLYSFSPDPEKTFNRGYTNYFIEGEGENLSSVNTQKSIGKAIGKVTKIENDFFIVDAGNELVPGDGICYFDDDNLLHGLSINKIAGSKIITPRPEGLKTGSEIFRNRDARFIKQLSSDETSRVIGVDAELTDVGNNLKLSLTDEDGNSIEYCEEIEPVVAKNVAKMIETYRKQLCKTGDSVFYVKNLSVKLNTVYFLSISTVNAIRRNAIEKLIAERLKHYPAKLRKDSNTNTVYPQQKLSYMANVTNSVSKEFYKEHSVEQIEPGFELLGEAHGKVILTSKYCIKSQLNLCPFDEGSIKLKGIKEPLILNSGKQKFKLAFLCSECRMQIIMQ